MDKRLTGGFCQSYIDRVFRCLVCGFFINGLTGYCLMAVCGSGGFFFRAVGLTRSRWIGKF